MCTKTGYEILKGRGHSEDLGVDRQIILTGILQKQDTREWIGFIRLGTGTRDRLL
jgi:hypothetical protein